MLQQQESGGTIPIAGNVTVVRDANYYFNVGNCAAKAENWQLAIRCFKEMLKFDLTSYKKANVYRKMAWGYAKLEKPLNAAKNFMLAAELSISFDNKQSFLMFRFAGNNYEKCEDWVKAAECLERGARLHVDPAKKAITLARAGNNYEKCEDWVKAAECFERGARLHVHPKKKVILLARAGNNYEKSENWVKAAQCFKREAWLHVDPAKKAIILARAGNNYAKSENWAKGAECFEKVAECKTDPVEKSIVLNRAGRCFAKDGQAEKSRECFGQALEVAINDPERQRITQITMVNCGIRPFSQGEFALWLQTRRGAATNSTCNPPG